MPVQSRVRGSFLLAAGWVLLPVGIVMELAGFARWKTANGFAAGLRPWWDTYLLTPAILGLGGLVIYAGQRLKRTGRRHFARVLTSYEEIVDEPFVLYVRSFADDAARASLETSGTRGAASMLSDTVLSGRTEEEQLAEALRPIGSVVAIGRPGQRLPETGAGRLYVADEDWRSTVLSLMERAQLVVLALGSGPGLIWELLAAFNTVDPERLVLVIPMEPGPYEQFREQAGTWLHDQAQRLSLETDSAWTPRDLPDYPAGEALRTWTSSIRAIVYYSNDWTPSFVRLDTGQAGVPRPRNQVLAATRRALRPLLARRQHMPTS